MIFNSNGKSFLNRFKFDNEYFETVKSYCYLGVTVSYTGNLSQTSKNVMEKCRKAWFKIKKTITLIFAIFLKTFLIPWLSPSSCMEVKFEV